MIACVLLHKPQSLHGLDIIKDVAVLAVQVLGQSVDAAVPFPWVVPLHGHPRLISIALSGQNRFQLPAWRAGWILAGGEPGGLTPGF
jgi:hypothetical protein